MSTARRITKKNTEEAIDIETFKAWLQGVEDMQDEGWVPSSEQWKKIRAKIDKIVVEMAQPQTVGWTPPYPTPVPMPSYPPIGSIGPMPRGSIVQEAPRLGQAGALPGFQAPGAGNGSGMIDVPQDDSVGGYESSFT